MGKRKAFGNVGSNDEGSAKIIVNKQFVQLTEPNDYLQYMLTLVSQFKYSPFQVIKENLVKVLDIFDDFCECKVKELVGHERAKFTKALKDSILLRKRFNQATTIDAINSIYFEKLLCLSGMGTLRGFGACTRFGDPLYGDPEKIPVEAMWSKI